MKKIIGIIILAVALTSSSVIAEEGITVVEKRLDNGDSEITVTDNGKVTATYKINMSTHHHPALTKDDPLMKRWSEFKFGAFLCYNSNQYSGIEGCTTNDPGIFTPTKLDVRQWVDTIKAAGMDHAVLTVRHTSDFLLWDSATSECDVMKSSVKTDIVKQYVEECRRQNIKPGIYYCLWGTTWNKNPNARALILAQLHELATKYGPIPYFWIDMPAWIPADLSIQESYDSLKNVNPDCIVLFNEWRNHASALISHFPTDVLTGEMHQSHFVNGHNPVRKVGDKTYYIPLEYEPCSQNRGTEYADHDYQGIQWFTYGEGKGFTPSKPYAPLFLYNWIELARKRGASNILLACAPDHTGSFRQGDIEQLTELGKLLKDPDYIPKDAPLTFRAKASASGSWSGYGPDLAFDNNRGTRWAGAMYIKDGWLAVDLGKPKKFSKVKIHEGWGRIRKFELQIKKNDKWQTVHSGTTAGETIPQTSNRLPLNMYG